MKLETKSIKVEAYSITLESLKNLNHELKQVKNTADSLKERTIKLKRNFLGYLVLYFVTVINASLSIITFSNKDLDNRFKYILVAVYGLIVILTRLIEEKLSNTTEIITDANVIAKHIDSIYVILGDYTTTAEVKISNADFGISGNKLKQY